MPRDGQPARRRLLQAALELFAENGFDRTTGAQIAERAGVSERTFFRHFPDKREVLFQGQAILAEALTSAIAQAPTELTPMEVLREAFGSITDMLEQNRAISEPRMRIIAATPALQEREFAKHAALVASVAEALRNRSIPASRATLAAQTGLAVLSHALAAWFSEPPSKLACHLENAFEELQSLTGSVQSG